VVTAASGGCRLERVSIARLGARARTTAIDADVLAVAYGFRASTELTALAGCAHGYDEARGGRFCEIDPDTGATRAEHVFAAGEVTGIGGSRVAQEQGRIAGLTAARSLGRWDAGAERRLLRARRRLRREQSFAGYVNRTFAVPPSLTALVTDDTVLCRCEEVRARDVAAAVADGARTLGAVKMWTRLGMGPCQGRFCGWSAGRYIARLTGADPAAVGVNEPRIPIKPVPVGCVLDGAGEPA
jgi:NAD(P)H-nitrite reductase large subunit